MLSNKFSLVESFYFKFPKVKQLLDIVDLPVDKIHHPEHDTILSHFTNPQVIIVVGIVTRVLLIEPESRTKFHVICIDQQVAYSLMDTATLRKLIRQVILYKGFIPQPFEKKIVWLKDLDSFEGELYTEYMKNHFSSEEIKTENLSQLDKDTLIKIQPLLTHLIHKLLGRSYARK